MLRSLALAASLAAVLTVSACSMLEPSGGASTDEQPLAESQQAPAEASEELDAAGAAGAGPADAESADAGSPDAGASPLGAPPEAAIVRLNPGVPGLPVGSGASIDDVLRLGAVATWVDAPGVLALSLPATSECWASASPPIVESASEIVVEFSGAAACAQPYTARTYTVRVPEGVEPADELTVSIEGLALEFTLTLPAS